MDIFIVTAYAKAPQNTSMYEVYKNIGVILEIDWQTRIVVDAEVHLYNKSSYRCRSRDVITTN